MSDDKETNPLKNNNQDKVQNLEIGNKDPLLVTEVMLSEDFYALTWNACRKKAWEGKTVAGIEISLTPSNQIQLVCNFLIFLFVVLMTVGILGYESFLSDVYQVATPAIIILRITLVAFTQQLLEPEMYQGLALLRYTIKKENSFLFPGFAKFVALSQIVIALFTFCSMFLFLCMSDEALELIMNFAGLAVISELDNWVGEQIMAEKLYEDYDNLDYEVTEKIDNNLNDRMSLFTKMCVISDDLIIEDDQNSPAVKNVLFDFMGAVLKWVPWVLVPLLTLPFESFLQTIQVEGVAEERVSDFGSRHRNNNTRENSHGHGRRHGHGHGHRK